MFPPPRCRQRAPRRAFPSPPQFSPDGVTLAGEPQAGGSGLNTSMSRTTPRIAFPLNLAIDNADRTESIVSKTGHSFRHNMELTGGVPRPPAFEVIYRGSIHIVLDQVRRAAQAIHLAHVEIVPNL